MLAIFSVSFFSVLRIFLVCLAGTWLARRGIFTPAFRRSISQLILQLMLPCLLIVKLSESATAANLARAAVLPMTALVYVALGFAVAALVLVLVRPPRELRRTMATAMVFGNSGYIPYPLVVAIASTAPVFAADPGAGERGMVYVSLYLVCYSPCLWGIGYPYLSHKPWRSLRWSHILSPPIISAMVGISIGVVPPLRALFVADAAPLRILIDAAQLIGQGVIPCALLVLGANLADPAPRQASLPARVLVGVAWGRLILMPLLGCVYAVTLHRLGWTRGDPMLLLVLMLESAVPSATNLIVMSQAHGHGEAAMSRILVTTYILAVFTLTFFVTLFLWLLPRL